MSEIKFLKCPQCHQEHIQVDYSRLDKEQLAGVKPIFDNYICKKIARMYRVGSFAFDLRVNSLKSNLDESQKNRLIDGFRSEWGEENFDKKLKRFIDLDLAFIGMPDEYYSLLNQVISTYVCGYFYPAQTSAGALGERLLNRLLIRTRDYYKSSRFYKKVYRKESFDNWDLPIEALNDWGVISEQVAQGFSNLKKFRNDSIHYNYGYNFEQNSPQAIKLLADIINTQFNYQTRIDLFWVFNVPGEIWVRSSVVDLPFVKEFVLPHCLFLTPFCEPTLKPPVQGNGPIGPISDEEFIKLRKDRRK